MSDTCERSRKLIDLAHDMFEREEIDWPTYRAVCAGAPPACSDRTCTVCYRQDARKEQVP